MLSYVASALSLVSLWLQVMSLPLLCRKYQQTLEISCGHNMTDSIAVLGDSYGEVVVNVN